jgi:hypothetical protein
MTAQPKQEIIRITMALPKALKIAAQKMALDLDIRSSGSGVPRKA